MSYDIYFKMRTHERTSKLRKGHRIYEKTCDLDILDDRLLIIKGFYQLKLAKFMNKKLMFDFHSQQNP